MKNKIVLALLLCSLALSAQTTTKVTNLQANNVQVNGAPWFDPTHPAFGCKGDGVTDDTACFQAAITAAQAVNGTVFLPPNKSFVIACSGGGTDCLAATKPIRIVGVKGGQAGVTSALIVNNTISNTKHLLHLTVDTNTDGIELADFAIICQSGTCDPLSLVNFDGSTNGIARAHMHGVLELGTFGTDTCGLRVTNPANTNGFFDNDIGPLNVIVQGSTALCLQRIGDDNRFFDNNFVGGGIGANFSCVAGALGDEFRHNVFTTLTAAIKITDACSGVRIHENQLEGTVAVTGSNGAYLDVDCTTTNKCVDIQIYNNQKIAPVATNINGIRLNWVRSAQISNNAFYRAGGTAVDVITTANNDPASSILLPNDYEPNPDTQAGIVNDSASQLTKVWGFPQSQVAQGGLSAGMDFSRPIGFAQGITIAGGQSITPSGGGAGYVVPSIATPGNLVGTTAAQTFTNKGFGDKLTKYNNINLVGNGVPAEYATTVLGGQTAAIGSTLLYAVPAGGSGRYRVTWYAKVTIAATTSSTLGGAAGFQVSFTDAFDSVAVSSPTWWGTGNNGSAPTSASGNNAGTMVSGEIIIDAQQSTNVNFQFGYTSAGATVMVYEIAVAIEAI